MQVVPTKLVRFLLGVELIRRYEIDAQLSVTNGFIYVGSLEKTAQMPQNERDLIERYGWVEGDRSWAFYV